MNKFILIFIFVHFFMPINSQELREYDLIEIVKISQSRSSNFNLAKTQAAISTYKFSSFKSEIRPQMSLYGNAPVLNKEYFGVRQPDGTIIYRSINQNNSSIGLGLNQLIPFTGGEISLNTSFSRFDDFNYNVKQYNITPVYLKLNQPIFGINNLKWQKKIQPLLYEESLRTFNQEMEKIAYQAVLLFFVALEAQSDMEIASSNMIIVGDNLKTEKSRVSLGTTSEDKLLQLKLQELICIQDFNNAKFLYQTALLKLKTYIGLDDFDEIKLKIPNDVPNIDINIDRAINWAKNNRPEFVTFQRRNLEALLEVKKAKASSHQIDLSASFGLNNAAADFNNIYSRLNNQLIFNLGFNIPIVDWGRRKARLNTAIAEQDYIMELNKFEESKIQQEIKTIIKNVELLKSNIGIAKETESVALKRFQLSNKMYQGGKITITELNIARQEKDTSKKKYIYFLRSFWLTYYDLRVSTTNDINSNNQK